MAFLELFKSDKTIQLDKKTLVILRWIAIIGQFITINFVFFALKFNFHFFYCCLIIFLGVLSNVYLQFKVKKKQLNNIYSFFYLLYDLIQLHALLFLTGGITNPFVILLIIPAIVSSTFLDIKSTLNLLFITITSIIVLTIFHLPLPSPGNLHFHVPSFYLYGVPIGIIIGLIFLTYFGARFGMESRKRNQALNKLELVLAKEHELKTIGVQAAAAAHSLGTPLTTINIIAKELKKEIGDESKYSKDINLLLSQTSRCSDILKKLSMVPLERDIFFENIKLKNLISEITKSFEEISDKKIYVNFEEDEKKLIVRRKAELTYALRNFIGNAVKFSRSKVEVFIKSNDLITEIRVCDDGPGFPDDVKNFLGEPYIRSKDEFFKSKPGTGLGVFIGKTLLERMKANVIFDQSQKNKGAIVIIQWKTNNLLSI